MYRDLTEYAVSYGVKEYLIAEGWDVIAYNPPGSQGTFTIPNPAKDGSYRGQTGSESPDIVAVKNNTVLVIEAKPSHSSSDLEKLRKLRRNEEKMQIFLTLIFKVCEANYVEISSPIRFIWALANSDEHASTAELGHISVWLESPFNLINIPAEKDYYSRFKIKVTPPNFLD